MPAAITVQTAGPVMRDTSPINSHRTPTTPWPKVKDHAAAERRVRASKGQRSPASARSDHPPMPARATAYARASATAPGHAAGS